GAGGATPPPPPSEPRSSNRMNANAALIAGVATLVLAIGVGFLIGRAGHDNGSNAAAEAPIKVIEVGGGGGGGGESTETASTAEESTAANPDKGKSKGGKESGGKKNEKVSAETEKNSEVGAHGASEATEEVLHTEGDVKLAEPEQEVGGS